MPFFAIELPAGTGIARRYGSCCSSSFMISW